MLLNRTQGRLSILECHTQSRLTSYSGYTLHLLSMESGRPHPAAENPTISFSQVFETDTETDVHSVSITNSRLAILVGELYTGEGVKMIVWDWRTGRILLVSGTLASATIPIQLKFRDRTVEVGAENSWDSLASTFSQCSSVLGVGILHGCKSLTRNRG